MTKIRKPELLAPAGDLEKLKFAVAYGADAVYIGGRSLGLRAKAKNFDYGEMRAGIAFAHEHNRKVYVTANIFAHNEDFDGMAEYFLELAAMHIDGLIITDPGIFDIARRTVPDIDIHISTQANTTNLNSVAFWHRLGASRVVLARELSLDRIAEIKRKNPEMQLETFIHGAMCISYSGRCLLSNYMSNRDSNRGECSHPCRWKYHLVEETRPGQYMEITEDERGTYIYNSKDLCMIEHIPELIEAGIDSFKIEGRMKTPYYVAQVVKAYRQAIDDYYNLGIEAYRENSGLYLEELKKTSHRDFTTGFYFGQPGASEQNYETSSYIRTHDFAGVVLSYDNETGMALVEQRNKFSVGDELEFLTTAGKNFKQQITEMYNSNNEPITSAPHAQQHVKVKVCNELKEFDMLCKKSEN